MLNYYGFITVHLYVVKNIYLKYMLEFKVYGKLIVDCDIMSNHILNHYVELRENLRRSSVAFYW